MTPQGFQSEQPARWSGRWWDAKAASGAGLAAEVPSSVSDTLSFRCLFLIYVKVALDEQIV